MQTLLNILKIQVILVPLLMVSICSVAQDTNGNATEAGDTITIRSRYNNVVTGIITQASTKKPLAAISVRYKNLSAAITDNDGKYTLYVPDRNVTVRIEAEGYQAKEIALKGRQEINTAIYEDSYTSFYDGANLPLGVQSKNQAPFSVSSIQTQGAWNRNFETADAYLQGKVAGLNSIRRSGTPNVGAALFLRGFNSLYATSQPLIVVDGVIYDINDYGTTLINNHFSNPLSFLEMKDIDNITVLKDGASIYGTKGANGVILVTTARAKELATRIDFSVYGGINFSPSNIPLLNASDYRTYLSGLLQTSGRTEAEIQASPYMNDDVNSAAYYRYHNNVDWQKQIFNNSYAQNYYLKVTGGDNIAKYALSIGYMKNAGVISNTDLKRYNMRFNADLNLSQRLTATTNLSITFNEQNLKDQGLALKTNPIYLALVKAPLLAVNEISDKGVASPDYAEKDTFNVSNPVTVIHKMEGENKNYRFSGSIAFNYRFSKAFSVGTTIGITKDKVRESIFIPRRGIVDDTLSNAVADSRSGSQVKQLFTLFNDTRLSFSQTIHRIHTIKANLGIRYIQSQAEQDFGLGFNSATDELVSVGNGLPTLRKVGGDIGEYRWINNYLNIDYSLSDKYILSFNAALDGSSRFGNKIKDDALTIAGNKFAFMPSIAGAWMVSSENFMRGFSKLELLKLRASAGVSGNDDIGNYAARQFYVSQNLLGVQGLVRAGFGNPMLQWEKVQKLNGGMDVSFFNERLNFSVDVFRNRTTNMLINEPAPAASGFIYTVTNSGAMHTRGVEVSVQTRVINKEKLKWDIGLNLAKYKSSIDKLPVDSIITRFAGAEMITRPGGAPSEFYGYQSAGVYSTDAEAAQVGYSISSAGNLVPFKGGDIKFIDRNGDKIIDQKDKTVIGNPNPDFTGSLNSRLEWKQWSVDVLFTFSKGNDIYNYMRSQLESLSGYNNQTPVANNSWKNNGDMTTIPKATWADPMGNSRFSDRWIEDGSYLRLRSASVSYALPLKPGFVKYSMVYLTAYNLFTVSKYLGYDPEFSSGNSTFAQGIDIGLEPQYRSVQLGLRIGL